MTFHTSSEPHRTNTLFSNASPLHSTQRPLCDTSGNANFRADDGFNFNSPPGPTPALVDHQELKRMSSRVAGYGQSIYEAEVKQKDGRPAWQWKRIPGALTTKEQPRYQAYRARSRKDIDKKSGKPVWPEELEDAFQIAIRHIPPILGKKKILLTTNGITRQYGRNELLAWKINKLTGVWRTRKQISSHIQVVRNFEDRNSELAKYISTDPARVQAASSKIIQFDVKQGKLYEIDPLASSHTPDLKMERSDAWYQPPLRRLGSSALPPCTAIQEIDFNMCIHSPTGRQDKQLRPIIEPWHTCTRVQSQMGAQPKTLAELNDWRLFFPDLASCLQDKRSESCEVLLFETSIDLMKTAPPAGSSVIIEFMVDICCDQDFHDWQIRSTFYEDKGKLESRPAKSSVKGQRSGSHRITVGVPLASKWWVKLFGNAMVQRREVEEAENKRLQDLGHEQCDCNDCKPFRDAARKALQDEENNCRRYFREMSIMQELFVTKSGSGQDDGASERTAIFLWRFRRTRPNETAFTTWRKIAQPAHKNEQSYATHDLMVLDPALQHLTSNSLSDHTTPIPNAPILSAEFPTGWDDSWTDVGYDLYGPSDNVEASFEKSFGHQTEYCSQSHQPQFTPPESTLSSNGTNQSIEMLQVASSSSSTSNIHGQDRPYASECASQNIDELAGPGGPYAPDIAVAWEPHAQYLALRDYYHRTDSDDDSTAGVWGSPRLHPMALGSKICEMLDAHDSSQHPSILAECDSYMKLYFQERQVSTATDPISYPQWETSNDAMRPSEDPSRPAHHQTQSVIHTPQPQYYISAFQLAATSDINTRPEDPVHSSPELCADGSTLNLQHRHGRLQHDPASVLGTVNVEADLLAHLAASGPEIDYQTQSQDTHTSPSISDNLVVVEEFFGDAHQLEACTRGQTQAEARVDDDYCAIASSQHDHYHLTAPRSQEVDGYDEHAARAAVASAVADLEDGLQDWLFVPDVGDGFGGVVDVGMDAGIQEVQGFVGVEGGVATESGNGGEEMDREREMQEVGMAE